MADEFLSVRDGLVTEFVVLDSKQTVTQAREELNKAGVNYGIVANAFDGPLELITAGALSAVSNQNIQLEAISSKSAFIVDAEILLDQTVSFSAQTLVENPDMAGLIVEDQGKIVGVLPRQVIRRHAQQIRTRGGDTKELAGVPQIRAKYFVCPKQDYKKLMIRYDPDEPPTCPIHELVLLEQS